MDFGSVLHVAQKNEKLPKKEVKYYSTKFEPPKKEERTRQLSSNIKKFLARKEAEEKRLTSDAHAKRDELLALRSQDKKATRRVSVMLKRTKSANKSVLEDAVDNVNTAVTLAGPSQPDEDDYGYVSQEASAFYNKMMAKYNTTPEDPKFSKSKKNINVNLNGTKDRVRAALLREQEEALLPHKRKRRPKEENSTTDTHSDEDCKTEPIAEKPFVKPKPKISAPPPINFSELLKLAEKKQFEPIKIEPKSDLKDDERPMTKKQKKEQEKEKAWRERKEKGSEYENGSRPVNKSMPPPNRIPKLNNSQSNGKIPKLPGSEERSKSMQKPPQSAPNIQRRNDDRSGSINRNEERDRLIKNNERERAIRNDDRERAMKNAQRERVIRNDDRERAMRNEDRERSMRNEDRERPIRNDDRDRGMRNDDRERPMRNDDRERPMRNDDRERPMRNDDRERPMRNDDRDRGMRNDDRERPMRNDDRVRGNPRKGEPDRGRPMSNGASQNGARQNGVQNPSASTDRRPDPSKMSKLRQELEKNRTLNKTPTSRSPGSSQMSNQNKLQSSKQTSKTANALDKPKGLTKRDVSVKDIRSGSSLQQNRPKQFPPSDLRPKQFPPSAVRPKQFPPADLKPKQFPPADLKPKQFPPADVRRKQTPSKGVKQKPPMGHKRRILDDDDSEYDSEMDDFIDDGQDGQEDYSKYISEIFGYDKSKYQYVDENIDDMDSSFSQVMKEEFISSKLGLMEDLEDMKQEAEDKKRKQERMKKFKK